MLKNTKSNSKKPASGYDRIEFYIDKISRRMLVTLAMS